MRPNALFLTPRLPYPLVGGDRVKAFHLLKLLAERYAVTCVSFVEDPRVLPAGTRALSNLGIELHTIPLNRTAAVGRVARTVLSDKPLEIQYYLDREFRNAVARVTSACRFDVIFSFFMRTAEYAKSYASIPRVLIAEDARVLLQERATERMSWTPGYFMRALEKRRLQVYEPSIVNAFDVTTYVTEADRAKILSMNPLARTAIVTNGVDLEEFPFRADQRNRAGLVFAGKMDVLHNVKMAQRIATEILPRVRRAIPDATCTIIGKNPTRNVRALEGNGVHVTGEVAHVGDAVAAGAVFVHPQEIGAGIQNKVLEAMAVGTPVVTTPIGISGIAAQHNVHAMIATSPDAIAAACVECLTSPELRASLARNARRVVEEHHTWEIVGRQLDSAIAVARARHGLDREHNEELAEVVAG